MLKSTSLLAERASLSNHSRQNSEQLLRPIYRSGEKPAPRNPSKAIQTEPLLQSYRRVDGPITVSSV